MRLGAPDRRRVARGFPDSEPRRPDLVARVLGSYHEMPGLSLCLEDASRLFGLRLNTCRVVLDDLVRTRHLRLTPRGHYAQ
jgi:hypothetical protein